LKGTPVTISHTRIARFGALVAASVSLLTACSADTDTPEANHGPAAESVTISDAWVKAADEGMSAAFGELHNSGESDVTVVSATTAAADMIELHETVENETGAMIMREIEGGFVIPASGALALEPGADHIMLMGLTGALAAGQEISFTLTFSDDSVYEFTAPVKDYAGANETYEDHSDHAAETEAE